MRVSFAVIGRNIRETRKRMEFTQEKAAALLGMSVLHYGRLERGERNVSLPQLAMIAEKMNTTMNALLSGSSGSFQDSCSKGDDGFGTIINHIAGGCSAEARDLMVSICQMVAQKDRLSSMQV